MPKSIAVLISDIHFNLPNLELAATAFLRAQFHAVRLGVPLVVAGDLMDTKANMRAEVVNRLLHLVQAKGAPETIVVVGNHDLCNEKGEEHSLNFLKPYATIVEEWQQGELSGIDVNIIPYFSNSSVLKTILNDEDFFNRELITIMHQGIQGSNMGDYIQDKSAITKEDVAGMRIISGHYHARQTIELPEGGSWDYIGNPYTLGFGEANDPEKGFQVLMSDGSLEFVPTKLRKHVVMHLTLAEYTAFMCSSSIVDGDVVKVEARGTREELAKWTKEKIADKIKLKEFKLDLFPTDTETAAPSKQLSNAELMDSLIDSLTNTSDERKANLKKLWRNIGT